MKNVSFVGTITGDGECFCWDNVKKEDKISIIGEENFQTDLELEEDFRKSSAMHRGIAFDEISVQRALEHLYPGDVMCALGCKPYRKYRFTVTAEEVD